MEYEVVSPVGERATRQTRGAVRLPSLDGKTIGEVSLTKYRGDQTFPIIREALRAMFPNVKIVPYTEFPLNESPMWQGVRKDETAAAYRAAFTKHGCDAIISGNGG